MLARFGRQQLRGKVATHCQPLGIVLLAGGEQGVEGVVAGNDEAGEVGQELTTQVEDDKEEVEGSNADDGVGLGNVGRLLDVVQGGVLGQLSQTSGLAKVSRTSRRSWGRLIYLTVELADVVLDAILGRHIDG